MSTGAVSTSDEQEVWSALHRHLRSVFECDPAAYAATTSGDLSLYEWWITPHRQDGLDFHLFMIGHGGMRSSVDEYRYDLLEPRLQLYGATAVVSYTFMLSASATGTVWHQTHNESRVLVRTEHGWKVVHVHKSPAWQAPLSPPS
ncbi:MAG: nuclear transport factor 2 family protein [Chloroflexota bacterium]|nr:nuclear transport factor 2 family protein [Chloroflexota bacterium]